jgi:hypothetical protein
VSNVTHNELDHILKARNEANAAERRALALEVGAMAATKIEGVLKNGSGLSALRRGQTDLAAQVSVLSDDVAGLRDDVQRITTYGCAIGETCPARRDPDSRDDGRPTDREWMVVRVMRRMNPHERVSTIVLSVIALAGVGTQGAETIARVLEAVGLFVERLF